ncbi:MAG: hypothetical protein RLP44_24675 [Aggregatilineales bacterium]
MINTIQQNVSLNRYARALERLRLDLKRSIHIDIYQGLGETVVRIYRGIHEGISNAVNDPYLTALTLGDLAVPAKDREKVALVNLLSGQLQTYLESVIENASHALATQGESNYGG